MRWRVVFCALNSIRTTFLLLFDKNDFINLLFNNLLSDFVTIHCIQPAESWMLYVEHPRFILVPRQTEGDRVITVVPITYFPPASFIWLCLWGSSLFLFRFPFFLLMKMGNGMHKFALCSAKKSNYPNESHTFDVLPSYKRKEWETKGLWVRLKISFGRKSIKYFKFKVYSMLNRTTG